MGDINSAGEVAKKLGLDEEDLAGAGDTTPELKPVGVLIRVVSITSPISVFTA